MSFLNQSSQIKYEGRLWGRNLLTGRNRAENAHILAAYLQGDPKLATSKEALMFSTCREIFGGLHGTQSPTDPLWVAVQQTGLTDNLLDTLIKQEVRKSSTLPREEIDWGISQALVCLSIVIACEPWRLEKEIQAAAKVKIGEALRPVFSEYGLKSTSHPKEVYKIQCLTVMTMGILLTDLGLEYVFHDGTIAPVLGTLALAVIFDPVADHGGLDGIHRSIAQRHARNILTALSSFGLNWCFEDIASSVANKYGVKRITSMCNSYFANTRYIGRCYTGLRLCGAMASAESLHPDFINEGKLHLTVLRWYWRTFRGPQENHPDDKEAGDTIHDLRLLPGDSLAMLWASVPLSLIFYYLTAWLTVLLSITRRLSPDLLNKILRDLVIEGDLIMVIGHWYFAEPPFDMDGTQRIVFYYVWRPNVTHAADTFALLDGAFEGFLLEIVKRYAEDQRFVTLYIAPAWKHVFKTFNSAMRSGVPTWEEDTGIKIWRCFGESLGLVEESQPDESHVQVVPDFVKCESLICPLYGEYAFEKFEPGVSGMKCTRCQLGMPENRLDVWANQAICEADYST
ncbi:hypothetical protein FS837_002793 [Tulasnella sp. UAMH 9824]|nr:hypothetical protein FS837_002793 [Tulasnella sp. UAMH 9824]